MMMKKETRTEKKLSTTHKLYFVLPAISAENETDYVLYEVMALRKENHDKTGGLWCRVGLWKEAPHLELSHKPARLWQSISQHSLKALFFSANSAVY